VVPGCVQANAAFPCGKNSVSEGSKFGERVYGPDVTLPAQQLEQLLKTIPRVALCQHLDNRFITPGIGLVKIHRPAQR